MQFANVLAVNLDKGSMEAFLKTVRTTLSQYPDRIIYTLADSEDDLRTTLEDPKYMPPDDCNLAFVFFMGSDWKPDVIRFSRIIEESRPRCTRVGISGCYDPSDVRDIYHVVADDLELYGGTVRKQLESFARPKHPTE